ncbi:hypothetical protein SAMN04489729_7036 [Amycolatopsis lurida]|uniref:Uncharacterized protein n=1 Tax=Amycolatopsis lurida NRRL 2430 TaxID=1460371 RepID=A0A2P2FG03_AMYLU|nr:hypothetical protein [Amycolatopsis lurida]KFU75652.1 hypothetical protein BB31_40270 [Amycolatopsis lurida NRRL 2430]SEE30849.1 hypothetical protein SAMN04489729_7036 [Amycolatopsis lurida]
MPDFGGHLHEADFVTDPATPLDELANSVHSSAFDLVKQVLNGLRAQGDVTPSSPGFLTQYAAAAGIGLVIMAFSSVFAVVHSMRRGGRDDLRESLFKYLPSAVFLITFSPAIGVLVLNVANAITKGIVDWGATTIGKSSSRVDALAGITADKLPGGTFVGLLVALLIVVGALGVFIVLAVEKIGLPVAGIIAGIGWGMFVHPQWRLKALRVPGIWLGLVCAKPLLFLLLAAAFGAFGAVGEEANGVAGLIQLCLLAVTLVLSSAGPLLLVRKFPVMGGARAVRQESAGAAPVGLRGPAVGSLDRVTVVSPPSVGPNPADGGLARTIEQAYEQGQRNRNMPQRDRGQPKERPGSTERSYLDESVRTEVLTPKNRGTT